MFHQAVLILLEQGLVGGVTDTAGKTVGGVTDTAGNAGKATSSLPFTPALAFPCTLSVLTNGSRWRW